MRFVFLRFALSDILKSFDLVLIVAILQLATLTGYTIITSIVSGQTLTALSEGSLSLAVGIVLTVIVALCVSFMGYNFLHYFEQYSWIPSMVALIVTVGVGSKSLRAQTEPLYKLSCRLYLSAPAYVFLGRLLSLITRCTSAQVFHGKQLRCHYLSPTALINVQISDVYVCLRWLLHSFHYFDGSRSSYWGSSAEQSLLG